MLHNHAFRAGDHVRKEAERRAQKLPMEAQPVDLWLLIRPAIFPAVLVGSFGLMAWTALVFIGPLFEGLVK